MYILGEERDKDVAGTFSRYREYLDANSQRFPESAYELATSDWYFGATDHKAPHAAWLEKFTVSEPSSGDRSEVRSVELRIRLLSAYHDGYIEFYYPKVFEYQVSANHLGQGHGDWRYDEFRVNDAGQLIHEIEWATFGAVNSWKIVASDVRHIWSPL